MGYGMAICLQLERHCCFDLSFLPLKHTTINPAALDKLYQLMLHPAWLVSRSATGTFLCSLTQLLMRSCQVSQIELENWFLFMLSCEATKSFDRCRGQTCPQRELRVLTNAYMQAGRQAGRHSFLKLLIMLTIEIVIVATSYGLYDGEATRILLQVPRFPCQDLQ